jgi:hypothetical protein
MKARNLPSVFPGSDVALLDDQLVHRQRRPSAARGGTWRRFRTVLIKCVNVKAYGAKGDGVTDDTASVRTALASAGQVFLPMGTYVVSDTITLSAGQGIFGQGFGNAIGYNFTSPNAGTVIYVAPDTPGFGAESTKPIINVTGPIRLHFESTLGREVY